MKLLYPIPFGAVTTQTFADHVNVAKSKGWCYRPGNCPSGIYYYGGHDWAIPIGTPVKAAASGTAEAKIETRGYGIHVRITHPGGYVTIYGHLSKASVPVSGKKVNAGDVIGYSGSTGFSSGPHLHFELRKDGVPIDPIPLLTFDSPVQDDSEAPEQHPQPQQPPHQDGGVQIGDFQLPVIPKHHSAVVTKNAAPWLYVRSSPGRLPSNIVVGTITPGAVVRVLDLYVEAGKNVWCAIGYADSNGLPVVGWSAALYDGNVYLNFNQT